jgi:uncharacterized protein with NRDE domain
MSLIPELGDKNVNIVGILERYEKDLQDVEKHIVIEGKRLEKANLEQATWLAFYDQRRIELYTLVKHFESEIARVRGKLWVKFKETHSRELGSRDIEQYINKEVAYLSMNELYLEVNEVYKKYESVVEAFKNRGFALRNITSVRVSQLEDVIL